MKQKFQLINLDAKRCPDGYEIRGGRLYARSSAKPESAALGAEVYLEFYDLEPNADAIIEFAKRYGALVTPDSEEMFEHGEPLEEWRYSINDMQVTIRHLANGELDRARYAINDELNAPMTYQQLVDMHPDTKSVKRGMPLPPKLAYTLPQAVIIDKSLQLSIQAPNLKSFIWLQLLSVTGKVFWRRCRGPGCGQWMPIGQPSGRRTNYMTHTKACRVRFNAHLRGLAVRLRAQRQSYLAIVKRLKAEGWQPGKHDGRSPEQQIKEWTSQGAK